MKTNLILTALLGLSLLFALTKHHEAETAKIKAQRNQQNTEVLLTNLKRMYDEKQKLEQQNKALDIEAKKDKSFNWHTNISNTYVIKRLQAN